MVLNYILIGCPCYLGDVNVLEDRQHYLFISGLPKQGNISGGYHGWNCSELYQDTERQIRVVQGK